MLYRPPQPTERRLAALLFRPALLLTLSLGLGAALIEPSGISADVNDKLQHLVAFGVLAGLSDYAFPARPGRFWHRQVPLLLLYGILIELLQSMVPYRSAELLDLLADGAGIVAYGLLRPLLALVWHPAWSRRAAAPAARP